MSELRARVNESLKSAMKAGEKDRVAALRLVTAAVKQFEVDKRETPDDAVMLALLDKMVKQRRESIEQYASAGRDDLVAKEQYELGIIQEFLPTPLTDQEIDALIDKTIAETGASSVKDMGKVMGRLKSELTGRADMAAVSTRIKARLTG